MRCGSRRSRWRRWRLRLPAFAALWTDAMLAVTPRGDCAALRGAPANGTAGCDRSGGFQGWLEDVLCNKMVDRTPKPSGLLRLAQRLFSFGGLNDFWAGFPT